MILYNTTDSILVSTAPIYTGISKIKFKNTYT